MKEDGAPADLMERIAADPAFGFSRAELDAFVDPRRFVGRAPEQVLRFLDEWVVPMLVRHQARAGRIAEASIHV
jgi:adenylosuccinate lyase